MRWLDQTDIGHDLQVCPDCDTAYEVLDQFSGRALTEQPAHSNDLQIDAVFNDAYYVALRCPQCLEMRHLCLQSLTATQFYREKEGKRI